jgi:serine protease Do
MTPLKFFVLASLLFASSIGFASAQDPEFKAPALKPAAEKLPEYFSKKTPGSVEELKAIQDHVAKIVDQVMPAVVSVRVGQAFGSGVIVSKDGYVLTAGHVSGAPDRDVTVYFHDGKTVKGKTLGGNHGIDSGMIKILDRDDLPFVEMADSAALKPGDWCLVIAHHGGYKKGRTPPVRLGRVLNNDEKRATITTDAVLVGGDSGGPLFDMHGRVIGINSRIGNSLAANMHVSVNPFRDDWDKIAKGEVLGGKNTPYIGIEMDTKDNHVLITAVTPKSPAEKAGLKANDLVLKFDDKEVDGPNGLATLVRSKKAGDRVVIEVRRGDEVLNLRVEIGKR